MAEEQIPEGQLFTHVYLDRIEPSLDSPQFRKRIGYFAYTEFNDWDADLASFLKKEMGLHIPGGSYKYDLEEFFEKIETKYVFNGITLIWRFFIETGYPTIGKSWFDFAQRAMKEENLGYYLDEKCGVHFLVDKEFESNRVSTLRCLEESRYSGVRQAFDHAFNELDETPPHTKDAIRSIFESLEILVKQMVETQRLNKIVVQNSLKEIALEAYKENPIARKSVDKIFDGFGEWVDAIHNYRHGQDVPEPKDPPIEFAVYILSSGASFLRWLVEIDKTRNK